MKSGLSQSKIAPREGPGVNCCFLDKHALVWTNSAASGVTICALMTTRGLVLPRQRFVRSSHECKKAPAIDDRYSGDLLPPSPPAEKAAASKDQAGQSSTGYGAAEANQAATDD